MTSQVRGFSLLVVGALLVVATLEVVTHGPAGDFDESACVICHVAHQPGASTPVAEVVEPAPAVVAAPDPDPTPVGRSDVLLTAAPSRAPPA